MPQRSTAEHGRNRIRPAVASVVAALNNAPRGFMLIVLLYSIAGGMLAVLASGRPTQLAWRFLRRIGLIALVVGVIPATQGLREGGWQLPAWRSPTAGGILCCAGAAAVIMLAPLASQIPFLFRLACAVGGLAGIAAACGSTFVPAESSPNVLKSLLVTNQVLACLLLGGITVAWMLGHAYLTATKMTIAPLRHFSRVLIFAVLCRIGFVAISFGIALAVMRGVDPPLLTRLRGAWLIVLLRVGLGLLGVGAFALMVSECVKIRATQSATGILFFGSLFAYMGELAAQHLLNEIGWPL